MASAMCSGSIFGTPSKSAMVRGTFRRGANPALLRHGEFEQGFAIRGEWAEGANLARVVPAYG